LIESYLGGRSTHRIIPSASRDLNASATAARSPCRHFNRGNYFTALQHRSERTSQEIVRFDSSTSNLSHHMDRATKRENGSWYLGGWVGVRDATTNRSA
jgi:hypothetical protein